MTEIIVQECPPLATGQIWHVQLPAGALGLVVLCAFTDVAAQRHGVVGTIPLVPTLAMATDWDLRLAATDSSLLKPYLAAAWHPVSVCISDLVQYAGTLHSPAWTALRRLYWANVGHAPLVPAEVGEWVGPPLQDPTDPRATFQVTELVRWEPVAERAYCRVLAAG